MFGYDQGDVLFKEIVWCILVIVCGIDMVVWLVGDEFIIILLDLFDDGVVMFIICSLFVCIVVLLLFGQESVEVLVSIGVVLYLCDVDIVELLFVCVD